MVGVILVKCEVNFLGGQSLLFNKINKIIIINNNKISCLHYIYLHTFVTSVTGPHFQDH